MAEIQISGLAELKQAMQDLPAKIEANIIRGGLRAAATVIRDEAARLVPESEPGATAKRLGATRGELKRSIRVSMRVRRKAGWVNARVVAGNKKAFYAAMIEEYGSARHWIRPKNRKSLFIAGLLKEAVDHPGFQPSHFMRRAWDSKHREAIEAMAEYMRQRLPKELKKAGR